MSVASKVLIFVIFGYHLTSAKMNDEANLISHLLTNYSSHARPVTNFTTPMAIKLGLELSKIFSLKEKDQEITYKMWLRMTWTNELLAWNPGDWGGVTAVSIPPQLLWVPDIVMNEEVTENVYQSTSRYSIPITVTSNGRSYWLVPLVTKCSCKIRVEDFPFDRQTCTISFISMSHDITKIALVKDGRPIVTDEYVSSSEWVLEKATSNLQMVKYECCEHPYARLAFKFHLKRKPLYYLYTAVSPCLVMIAIILFSFLLPSDCTERISVIITMLLAIVVFLQLISDVLPVNSDTTSKLSKFYLSLIVETTISLIATCSVIFVFRKGSEEEPKPVPDWVRNSILRIPEIKLRLKNGIPIRRKIVRPKNGANSGGDDFKLGNETESESKVSFKCSKSLRSENEDEQTKNDWQLLATRIDRGFFIVLLSLYVMTTCIFFLI